MRPTQPNSDTLWMGRALPRRMRGHVWPNPPVGCVIVKDGAIITEGEPQPRGRPHAERLALTRAGAAARGATLYVTLEPCCHWGKTPPCADAIMSDFLDRTRTGEPELIPAERAGAVPEGTDALLETRRGGHGLRLRDPGRLTEVACDLSPDDGLCAGSAVSA